ncbi:MAG: transcriptional regulator [Acidimicrobiia bacterium]|nr:transcriptional regulator [Acidimicrobiia bacterium]
MARKFSALRKKMTPDRQARVAARTEALLKEMPLQELRRAHALAQTTLADLLGMSQPDISKLEQRTDALISTVRRYVEAMGGELDIVARFPDGAVRITQFSDLKTGTDG